MNRKIAFYIFSLLSVIGDSILYIALPIGLGLKTGRVEDSLILFIIPAFFMFASSFVNSKNIASDKMNINYGKLLTVLGVVELGISYFCYATDDISQKRILMFLFVAIYSFLKEGIPRLYFNFAIYKYYFPKDEYTRAVGINKGLSIFGGLLGTIIAGYLVEKGLWEISLLLDASTFLIFGLGLMFMPYYKLDSEGEGADESEDYKELNEREKQSLSYIHFIVPFFVLISGMFWPILPLINEKLGVATAAGSIYLIALMKMPGLISGFFYTQIERAFSKEKIMLIVPWITIFLSCGYFFLPSKGIYMGIICFYGLMEGLYWPSDYYFRNKLPPKKRFHFNNINLKLFSFFQGIGCVIAFVIYRGGGEPSAFLSIFVGLTILGLSYTIFGLKLVKNIAIPAILLSLISCQKMETPEIVVPSLSHKIQLDKTLTYSDSLITNMTSAHLVTLGYDQSVKKEALKSISRVSSSEYIIYLDESYLSGKGEAITAEDLKFTFQHYIANFSDIMRIFKTIKGSESCSPQNCELEGLEIISEYALQISLNESNDHFINDMTSPSFMIFKKGRELYEKIGDCTVPYQTGKGTLVNCKRGRAEIHIGDKKFILKSKKTKDSDYILTSENSINRISPSMTTMFFIMNPSKTSDRLKKNIIKINNESEKLAKLVKLNHSSTYTSKWLGLKKKEIKYKNGSISCAEELVIVADSSIPYPSKIEKNLEELLGCSVRLKVVPANQYFDEFKTGDIGLLWFTPGYFDLYDLLSVFDCDKSRLCFFNYQDTKLQDYLRKLRQKENRTTNIALVEEVEDYIQEKGYIAPIAEMNWWFKNDKESKLANPAGLSQVRLMEIYEN